MTFNETSELCLYNHICELMGLKSSMGW